MKSKFRWRCKGVGTVPVAWMLSIRFKALVMFPGEGGTWVKVGNPTPPEL